MIFEAEEIVVGEIICIDEEVIEIKIEQSDSFGEDCITFSKFKDWACGTRWTGYAIGQRALFFLKTNHGTLTLMGGGNEGELPLLDPSLFIPNNSIALYYYETAANNKFFGTYEFWQNPIKGYKINLSAFWEMIQTLKNCFTVVEWDKDCGVKKIASTCDQSSIVSKFGQHQALFNWMHQKLHTKSQLQ